MCIRPILTLVAIALFLAAGEGPRSAVSPPWSTISGAEGSPLRRRLHPVSIIEADVLVNRFKTTMRLRFFAEDLMLIQGMEPDQDDFYSRAVIDESFEDHRKYLVENIKLLDIDGVPLQGKIIEINDTSLPEKGIEAGKLMEYSLGIVLEYPTAAPPEFLTMTQDVADPDFLYPAEVKVLVKQVGFDRPQGTMLKSNSPHVFRFDWSAPPDAAAGDESSEQKWFDEQRENVDLGIESYSSVYAFLYIGRYEVRHEILVPLASLASAAEIKFNNQDKNFLEINEQDAVRPQIEKYFVEGNPLTIDGVAVQPVVERVDFYGLDVRDFVTQAPRRRVSMASGRVGIMLQYSTKGPPHEVRLNWNRFGKTMTTVEAVIFPYDQAERAKFARYQPENVYTWKSPGAPPLPSLTAVAAEQRGRRISLPGVGLLGLAGILALGGGFAVLRAGWGWGSGLTLGIAVALGLAGWRGVQQAWPATWYWGPRVEPAVATSIFQQLHKNMFRAFDYHDEEQIYDALAASADGPLLRSIFLDINERLKMKDQGGAVSRIDEVRFLAGQLDSSRQPATADGFDFRCTWNLVGSIEHWGHVHQRSIVYDGVFRVELRDDHWKIVAMDILDEQPPKIKVSPRRLSAPPASSAGPAPPAESSAAGGEPGPRNAGNEARPGGA